MSQLRELELIYYDMKCVPQYLQCQSMDIYTETQDMVNQVLVGLRGSILSGNIDKEEYRPSKNGITWCKKW